MTFSSILGKENNVERKKRKKTPSWLQVLRSHFTFLYFSSRKSWWYRFSFPKIVSSCTFSNSSFSINKNIFFLVCVIFFFRFLPKSLFHFMCLDATVFIWWYIKNWINFTQHFVWSLTAGQSLSSRWCCCMKPNKLIHHDAVLLFLCVQIIFT